MVITAAMIFTIIMTLVVKMEKNMETTVMYEGLTWDTKQLRAFMFSHLVTARRFRSAWDKGFFGRYKDIWGHIVNIWGL